MPADPVAAGKKGGASRSTKKLEACRRNGFQRVHPAPDEQQAAPQEVRTAMPVLFVRKTETQ
jgi:hypothetical protein